MRFTASSMSSTLMQRTRALASTCSITEESFSLLLTLIFMSASYLLKTIKLAGEQIIRDSKNIIQLHLPKIANAFAITRAYKINE